MRPRVVLYVEDDDAAFSLAKIILQQEDPELRLLRASNGEQALSMLEAPAADSPGPDLILLDLNLPKKNGFEVLADLKASESLRSIPVVIFSTTSSGSELSDCIALGAQDCVTKPLNLDSYVEAVKAACCLPTKALEAGSGK